MPVNVKQGSIVLKHVLFDLTLFGPGDIRAEAETDIMWLLEGLTKRDQHFLKAHPNTPRLYKSGVKWSAPLQFGSSPEYEILKNALGRAANKKDVAEVLEKVSSVFGGEHFCDIGRILELGEIDCDGIACWRAAELRQVGIQARPYMTARARPDGGTTYHALVLWPPLGPECPRWTTEDPSLLLGMSQPRRKADRDEEIRKNQERCDILRRTRSMASPDLDMNAVLNEVLGLVRGR